MRILSLLINSERELCVCELVDSLEQPQYQVSEALKHLADKGLVSSRKEGKWVYYTLEKHDTPFIENVYAAVSQLKEPDFDADYEKCCLRLNLRKNGSCCSGIMKKEFA